MISEAAILKKLREVSLSLANANETVTFGHPTFQIEKKTFAVLETYKGDLGICVKVGELLQDVFLKDARFFRTPYIGKYGWVTLRVYAAPLNWREIRELVKGSYLLVAPPLKKRAQRKPRPRARR
jgi:predicted DNA-binding protein (MmcQ/YjbR family)